MLSNVFGVHLSYLPSAYLKNFFKKLYAVLQTAIAFLFTVLTKLFLLALYRLVFNGYYEFYLMENNEWRKVQAYSRKHYYSFIPFIQGKYKILALAKSYYKNVNYEDYDEITFYVKAHEIK